jgi:hypothetical protein
LPSRKPIRRGSPCLIDWPLIARLAALAALEAVESRDTSVDAILARQGEQRLDPDEFECHFGWLPTDDEG